MIPRTRALSGSVEGYDERLCVRMHPRLRGRCAAHPDKQEGPIPMAPKKKVAGLIKLQIQAGQANPAPPST